MDKAIADNSGVRQGLEEALRDLVSLEINTVESRCITGERYPGGAEALQQLLAAYGRVLVPGEAGDRSLPALQRAAAAVNDGPQLAVAQRVSANAAFLQALADTNPQAWTHRQRATLRKLWEIGADRIVAQSVITLDGDMSLRIDPALVESKGGAYLLQAHQQQVHAAMGLWGGLVKMLVDLLRGWVA